jgi:hypothetical protein
LAAGNVQCLAFHCTSDFTVASWPDNSTEMPLGSKC